MNHGSPLAFGLVIGMLVLSGCLSGRPGNGEDDAPPTATASVTPTSSSASTTPVESVGVPPPTIPSSISWNECRGVGASVAYGSSLVDMDRGATPPGWEPQPTDDTRYLFLMNSCQRVSVGSLERGPASFLWEVHWGARPPESCRDFEPGYEDLAILLSLWVDDPAVAAVLQDQLQMPVVLGEFHSDVVPQGDAEVQTWTWKAAGGQESTITVGYPGGPATPGAPYDRLVWHNGTGVQFFDVSQDRLLPDLPVPTAQGALAPPMRFATSGPTPFAGPTTVWTQGDFYGPIYRFGDLECKKPLA